MMRKLFTRIIRLHGSSKHSKSTCNNPNHNHDHDDCQQHDHHNQKQQIKSPVSNQPTAIQKAAVRQFWSFYTNGVQLSLANKLSQANVQFQKSLQQIRKNNQQQLQHYPTILRKIAHNLRRMGKMKSAQDKLYDIIKQKRQLNIDASLIYDDYDILFRHMITYDAQKASKLCRALLLKDKDQMPNSHFKLFQFNLGNAYLLTGKYNQAKKKFSQCLQNDPQGKLKYYTLNNLALGCWWAKNPFQKFRNQVQIQQKQKINKDFDQTKQILVKSIYLSQQSIGQLDIQRKILLQDVLDLKKGSYNTDFNFYSPQSLVPLYNLSQFYMANQPTKKIQILFWLDRSLELAQKINNVPMMDRISVQYSILTNNTESLKQILPQFIQKYRSVQLFTQQAYYNRVLSRISSGSNPKLSAQTLNRYNQLISVLPSYTFKLKNLAMDQLKLY